MFSRQVDAAHRTFALAGALFLGASALAATPLTSLENDQLHVGFSRHDGHLLRFTDRETHWNHLAHPAIPLGLWQLDLLRDGKQIALTPADARQFRLERGQQPYSVRLSWTGFRHEVSPQLTVLVEARLEADRPMSYWHITVTNLRGAVLEKVHFPRVSAIRPQADEYLAVPVWMGQLVRKPRSLLLGSDGKGKRMEWDYPGQTSLQCLAFYRRNGPGLYFSCDDTACYRKSFALWRGDDGQVSYEMVHLVERPVVGQASRLPPGRPALVPNDATEAGETPAPLPDRPSDTYTLPYDAIIGSFMGDWFTAAEQYRSWATNQLWVHESRLASGRTPEWVVDTGMWVWNRGRSAGVLEPAIALHSELGLPVNVFWHWWHGCAYDTGFPEYLPPREGVESFTNALARAHEHDVRAIVYMNQRLWGMTTESWKREGAERYAVKAADGTVHPEVYNKFTKLPCASMCMGTPFWRNKYASLAEQAVQELGVDGIYMDQACSSLACYDPNHGHSLGGGRYWIEGFRLLAGDIRSHSADRGQVTVQVVGQASRLPRPLLTGDTPAPLPKQSRGQVVLAGEGCGEGWLPYLDLMLSLQVSRERYAAKADRWQPIPFFQAVYHPYCVLYGNYSSLSVPPYDELWPAKFAPPEPLKLLDRKYSQQFLLEQARAFVWGQQPTVANFLPAQLHERSDETQYMMQLARLRRRALKYLQQGALLRPPELVVTNAVLPMSRLSIYAGQQGASRSFKRRYPLALAGAWQAPDGDVAVALASIASEPVTVALALNSQDYGLPGHGTVYRLGATDRRLIGTYTGPRESLSVPLAAREACVLEFSR